MVLERKRFRWYEGIVSRARARSTDTVPYGMSSDRIGGLLIPGRQARHDGIAMCLLRKDMAYAVPMRRVQRVARNRRLLVLLCLFTVLWWIVGWLYF